MDNLPVIVIRFALYADLMVLAGLVAFSLYALAHEERTSGIHGLG
jgi:putative copper resistance protein D